MEHQVAADLARAVGEPVRVGGRARQQEEPGRLDAGGGQDHDVRPRLALPAARVEVGDAARQLAVLRRVDPVDERARAQLRAVEECFVQERDRGAPPRVDRAAEARAEPARVAARPAMMPLDGVDRHRERVRLVAEACGPLRKQLAGVHRRVGRQRELVAAGRLLQGALRHPVDVALHAQTRLHAVVVRREVVVAERPVGHRRAGDRAEQGERLEVLLPEARRLRVPVDRAAAHDRREVVHVADERPVDALPCLLLRARGARLEDLVLVLERPPGLHLVVAEERPDAVMGPESGEQVPPLLEDEDRMARPAQRPRGRAAARPRADHDHGRLAHRPLRPLDRSQNRSREGRTPASAGRKRSIPRSAFASSLNPGPPASSPLTCASV